METTKATHLTTRLTLAALTVTLGMALTTAPASADLIYAFTGNAHTPTTDTEADFNGGAVTAVGFTLTDSASGNPAPSVGAKLSEVVEDIDLGTDYYTFTITKDAGATDYTLAQISFDYQVGDHFNSVHDTNFTLFSSVTGFANTGQAIASFLYNDGTDVFKNTGAINLGSAFQSLIADTEFRIYLDDNGSGSSAVYARIDNVTLNSIPDPASLALLMGLGGLMMLRRRR